MKKNVYLLSSILDDMNGMIRDGAFECLGLSNTHIGYRLLTFIEDSKFLEEINANEDISCIITKPQFLGRLNKQEDLGIIVSETPRIDFFSLHNKLSKDKTYVLEEKKTKIGYNCKISNLAYIDEKNVLIGDGVVIEEFVSIHGHCTIGDNVVIHSGTQIGGDGYEFKKDGEEFFLVEHCGQTMIGNNVIIWPNCTIHKAVYPWDKTLIKENTNINSQVHIDHGVKIGKRCEICASTVISGRADIDDHVFIGPGAVISNRINIGKGARVSLGSVVTRNIKPNEVVSGNFAIEHAKFLANLKEKVL